MRCVGGAAGSDLGSGFGYRSSPGIPRLFCCAMDGSARYNRWNNLFPEEGPLCVAPGNCGGGAVDGCL